MAGTPQNGAAQQRDAFGIGLMIGYPAGITAKKWTSNTTAIDGGAAWSLGSDPGIQLHADYLFHRSDLEGLREDRSFAYYGIGGRVQLDDPDTRVGVRIPLGVLYHFPDAPLDSFFEIVPAFDIIPETQLILNFSIGMRFYFSSLNTSR